MPKVIHFEIPAEDTKRAVAFYEKAFGWKINNYGWGALEYWLVTAGEDKEPGINGAIVKKDKLHPATVNTVSVSSFEEAVEKIKSAGGEVLRSKITAPGVGYVTYCRDTEGNVFGIMQTDHKAK